MLHLPAFGDEMNKSRAMTARAARAFAARGCAVLQLDLLGCGDSSGEHAEATLARWTDNARAALAWLRDRHAAAGTPSLWALRCGALLLTPLLEDAARDAPLLLWQPVLSGMQQLNQLLRQKLAGGLFAADAERAGMNGLRDRLRAGETLEVGGYAIAAGLADELAHAAFDVPPGHRGRVAWLEVAASAAPALSPAARAKIERLRAAGVDVAASALRGPGFWQSVEIEHCEPLIDASIAMLGLDRAHALSRDAALL